MDIDKKFIIVDFLIFLIIRLAIISSIFLTYSYIFEDPDRNLSFYFIANNMFIWIVFFIKLFTFWLLWYNFSNLSDIFSYYFILLLLIIIYYIFYRYKFHKTEKIFTTLYVLLCVIVWSFLSTIVV